MFGNPRFDTFFMKAVEALRPYLGDLICIGGCANALYRYHPNASTTIPVPYLGTIDTDWMTPVRLSERGRLPIALLMKQAGFVEEAIGADERPAVKYRLRNSDFPAEIEFLCKRSGIPGGREPKEITSHPVQEGLLAQPLRYLDILEHGTWELDLGRVPEFECLSGTVIRLPNPMAYVAQKILINARRQESVSKAKDFYYIYEISVIFRDYLDALATDCRNLERTFRTQIRDFKRKAAICFASSSAEGPTLALEVCRGNKSHATENQVKLTAEMIYRSVSNLLGAL
jgi:hypothetical protein